MVTELDFHVECEVPIKKPFGFCGVKKMICTNNYNSHGSVQKSTHNAQ